MFVFPPVPSKGGKQPSPSQVRKEVALRQAEKATDSYFQMLPDSPGHQSRALEVDQEDNPDNVQRLILSDLLSYRRCLAFQLIRLSIF